MTNEVIILVHGLWVNGLEMTLLKLRMENAGFDCHRFSYNSVAASPSENASKLNAFIKAIENETIHFVCHSLGGIVIRHLFHDHSQQKPGRIVTLGTPHRQSSAAQSLSTHRPGKYILGRSLEQGLLGDTPAWQSNRELASIAGTLRLGLGRLVPGIPRPSDGTVSVEETRLTGMKDHVQVYASHFGLLLSKQTVKQTIHFLQHGKFMH